MNRDELCALHDLYGGALTEKQDVCFRLHYFMDLSLSEIAEETGGSRQAARDSIVRAENTLRKYERQLGLYARHEESSGCLDEARATVARIRKLNADELLSIKLDDELRLLDKQLAGYINEE